MAKLSIQHSQTTKKFPPDFLSNINTTKSSLIKKRKELNQWWNTLVTSQHKKVEAPEQHFKDKIRQPRALLAISQ